ncbi:glycoside hydrolase family 5 protein [Sphingomonas crusticola]|uniref:glycoside hydrolase family 5 protein n=1 Tax=Sphingomonas crusticola TaxID=1697973 RepID=UPI000E27CEDE|nr:glycoside hydrolase family 5 protein [Sphingomonas crusticola]
MERPLRLSRYDSKPSAATPKQQLRKLFFSEGALRSAGGEIVVMRGMSLFWSQWSPQFYNADVVRWLAQDWKISVIRAPLAATRPGYLSHPQEEMDKISVVIEAALQNAIYVIVDWHAHDPETDAAEHFFSSIVRRFGDRPNILYETWNEPGPSYSWEADIKPHHQRMLRIIRQGAPSASLILGTPDHCRGVDVAARSPLDAENVGYALHWYAGSHGEGLRRRVQVAKSRGAAVIATEWGAGDATGGGRLALREARQWLRFLERHRISHLNWSLFDKAETCSALMPGADPTGSWDRHDLSPSGRFVRRYLRGQARLTRIREALAYIGFDQSHAVGRGVRT